MKKIYVSIYNFSYIKSNALIEDLIDKVKKVMEAKYNMYFYFDDNINDSINKSKILNADIYIKINFNKIDKIKIFINSNSSSKDLSFKILNQLKNIYYYNLDNDIIEENNNIYEISRVNMPIVFIEFPIKDAEKFLNNKINFINAIMIGIDEYFSINKI